MTKNLDPRYTNKIYWKGGTIDSSTTSLSITPGTGESDYMVHSIIASNTWTSAQTVKVNFLSTASATLSTIQIEVSGQAGSEGTVAAEDLMASMPLPVDNAGNKQLIIPQNFQLQLQNTAIQTTTELTFIIEVGDYEAD